MYFVGLSLDIYIAGHGFMYLLLLLFVCLMKTKNPDFEMKSGFFFCEWYHQESNLLLRFILTP